MLSINFKKTGPGKQLIDQLDMIRLKSASKTSMYFPSAETPFFWLQQIKRIVSNQIFCNISVFTPENQELHSGLKKSK